jgi:hypothetical protein
MSSYSSQNELSASNYHYNILFDIEKDEELQDSFIFNSFIEGNDEETVSESDDEELINNYTLDDFESNNGIFYL